MKHSLRISVSGRPKPDGIVTCRSMPVRERLLRFLLGEKQKVAVLIPGDTVREIAIREEKGMGVYGGQE